METHGLIVKGSHGLIQIDQTYKNLGRGVKGSITPTSPLYSFYAVNLVIGGYNNPVIATSCSAAHFVMQSVKSGSTVTYRLAAQAPVPIEYYIFDSASGGPGDYGLKVWDGTSHLVYDSRVPYLNVLGTLTGNIYDPDSPVNISKSYTGIYTPRKKLAVVQGQLSWENLFIPDETLVSWGHIGAATCSRVSGNSVIFSHETIVNEVLTGSGYDGGNQDRYSFLVTDVSDF